jgi:hypothetical protein
MRVNVLHAVVQLYTPMGWKYGKPRVDFRMLDINIDKFLLHLKGSF